MSRSFAFVQVDVFSEHVFGGNQLAVFLDAEGLSDDEMQSIAREMNFAETTFVLPPSDAACAARLRIFTPAVELPFAGHPTVGTAWVLAAAGRLPAGARTASLQEGIGPVPVRFEGDPSSPSMVWMAHRDAEFGPPLADPRALASGLGLSEDDLLPGLPVQVGSTGNPFLFVPLRTPEAVDRAEPDLRAIGAASPVSERRGTFVFAADPQRGPARLYARMFAGDTAGIPEDAATGSACGALGAYVAEHRLVDLAEPVRLVCLQGNKMLRPSEIHIRLDLDHGRATHIEIGGSVARAADGVLNVPA